MPQKAGLGQVQNLRGVSGKRGKGVFEEGGWYPSAHYG